MVLQRFDFAKLPSLNIKPVICVSKSSFDSLLSINVVVKNEFRLK